MSFALIDLSICQWQAKAAIFKNLVWSELNCKLPQPVVPDKKLVFWPEETKLTKFWFIGCVKEHLVKLDTGLNTEVKDSKT